MQSRRGPQSKHYKTAPAHIDGSRNNPSQMLKLSFACILATIVLGIALAGVPLKESVGAPLGQPPILRYSSFSNRVLQELRAWSRTQSGEVEAMTLPRAKGNAACSRRQAFEILCSLSLEQKSGLLFGSLCAHRYASVTDSFLQSFGAILVSEIGDKTFFIAALLAMKSSPHIVFAGAIGALAFMTILSVVLGYAAPLLLPREITHYAAVALFFFFGCVPVVKRKRLHTRALLRYRIEACLRPAGTSCLWRRERLKRAKSSKR